jgi:hypothetical protein
MPTLHVEPINFDWNRVLTATGDPYKFPMPAKVLGKLQDSPAVYRWDAGLGADGKPVIYIGETGSLRRRVNNYLRMHGPKQKTNVRLFELFSELVSQENGIVRLDILRFDDFIISNKTIKQSDLSYKWVRVLLECLLVAHFLGAGYRVLNLSVNAS